MGGVGILISSTGGGEWVDTDELSENLSCEIWLCVKGSKERTTGTAPVGEDDGWLWLLLLWWWTCGNSSPVNRTPESVCGGVSLSFLLSALLLLLLLERTRRNDDLTLDDMLYLIAFPHNTIQNRKWLVFWSVAKSYSFLFSKLCERQRKGGSASGVDLYNDIISGHFGWRTSK